MNLASGENLQPFVIGSVSAESMKSWAVFLHDPNPIHLDAEVVRAKGLGDRVINQGPANVAYLINLLLQNFPGCRLEHLDTRFLDNVYGGDRVEACGEITGVTKTSAGIRVECSISLDVAGRGAVISGTAAVVLPADEN